MLLPGHSGGVNWYEQHFWTDADFFEVGQHAYLYKNTILVTPKCWKYQSYDIDSRSPPSSLICAIYSVMTLFTFQKVRWPIIVKKVDVNVLNFRIAYINKLTIIMCIYLQQITLGFFIQNILSRLMTNDKQRSQGCPLNSALNV